MPIKYTYLLLRGLAQDVAAEEGDNAAFRHYIYILHSMCVGIYIYIHTHILINIIIIHNTTNNNNNNNIDNNDHNNDDATTQPSGACIFWVFWC